MNEAELSGRAREIYDLLSEGVARRYASPTAEEQLRALSRGSVSEGDLGATVTRMDQLATVISIHVAAAMELNTQYVLEAIAEYLAEQEADRPESTPGL